MDSSWASTWEPKSTKGAPRCQKGDPKPPKSHPGEASGPKRASLVPTHYLPYRTHAGGSRRHPFRHFSLARSPSKRQAEKYVTKGGATGAQGTPRRRQGRPKAPKRTPKSQPKSSKIHPWGPRGKICGPGGPKGAPEEILTDLGVPPGAQSRAKIRKSIRNLNENTRCENTNDCKKER